MNSEICIYKDERRLELWIDDVLFKSYRIGLGFSPKGAKIREGDGRVPEGEYYICTKNNNSKFTLFLGLSYPNDKDADRGFAEGVITQEECLLIKKAIHEKTRPHWETALGGKIGIHGMGSAFDWTAGCISLDDEHIRELWKYVELGTNVRIHP